MATLPIRRGRLFFVRTQSILRDACRQKGKQALVTMQTREKPKKPILRNTLKRHNALATADFLWRLMSARH